MNDRTNWTVKEDEFLKQYYDKWYTSALAEELKRSESSIRKRAWQLGLVNQRGSFADLTYEVVDFITKNYSTMKTKEISEYTNVSESRIRRFAISRGLLKEQFIGWSEEKERFLIENASLPYTQLVNHLNKSERAIVKKLKELNLKKPGRSVWAKIEIDYLTDRYGNESLDQISNYLNRSKKAIQIKCFELGLEQKNANWAWSDWEEKLILESEGKTLVSELMKKTTRSESAIRFKKKAMGIITDRSTIVKWHDVIVKMTSEGKYIRDIAKEIGHTQTTLKGYCKRNGIEYEEDPSKESTLTKSKKYGLYKKVDLTSDDLTVCEWYAYWFLTFYESKISDVTKNKYRADFCVLYERGLGRMKLSSVKRADIQSYINVYGVSRSKTTVLDHIQRIRSLFRDAMFEGLISVNPAGNIEPIFKEQNLNVHERKKLREQKKHLEKNEYQKLKFHLIFSLDKMLDNEPLKTGSQYIQMIETIIFLGLKTGARISEILGITKEDIDFDNFVLKIEKTWNYKARGFKTTKNLASIREIAIDEETISILTNYLAWLEKYSIQIDEGAIFILEGISLFNDTINKRLKKILIDLEIEPISFHKLRHTQASILIGSDVPLEVVAKRLGHTDTSMIQRVYGHLLKDTEDRGNQMILRII